MDTNLTKDETPVQEDDNPQKPSPQTVFGILTKPARITRQILHSPGLQPDITRWNSHNVLIDSHTLDSDYGAGNLLFEFDPHRLVGKANNIVQPWLIPHFASLFSNPTVTITLWANKMPLTPGRIGIFYTPFRVPGKGKIDEKQRNPLLEWDLSTSNTISFDVTSFNPALVKLNYPGATIGDGSIYGYSPYHLYGMGSIRVEVLQRYQPGQISPKQCTVFMFKSYKTNYYTPCALGRNLKANFFTSLT